MKVDKNANVEQEGTVVALILGRNYKDADISIANHDVYKKVKQAVETYERAMREVGEQTLKDMDLEKFETEQYKIQKIKRGIKKPVNGLKKGMIGVKQELVQDTKALSDYVKENGRLPDGWVEVVSEYIKFEVK
mgnify:FL=1